MTVSKLSELEMQVLGVVWLDGPCTAYHVRELFRKSPSPRYSGSAGAIYPLFRRLEQAGYVISKVGRQGKRSKREFRLTRRGMTTFKKWLREVPDIEAAVIHDPLRSRVRFLAALPADQARDVIDEALRKVRAKLPDYVVSPDRKQGSDQPFLDLAVRNAVLVTKARIRWLEEVQRKLAKR